MNYYLANGELLHYGVKGMKWGRRKARDDKLITISKANRAANAAASKARRDSVARDKAAGVSGVGSFRKISNNATKAGREARNASIAESKAKNAEIRSTRKRKARAKGIATAGATFAAAALVTYGGYKISQLTAQRETALNNKRILKRLASLGIGL